MKTEIICFTDVHWYWTASDKNWGVVSQYYTRRRDAVRGLYRYLSRVRAK